MMNAQNAKPNGVDVEKAHLSKKYNDSMIMKKRERRTMAKNTLTKKIMKAPKKESWRELWAKRLDAMALPPAGNAEIDRRPNPWWKNASE